jgi:netrin-G1 ligand
LDLSYNSLSAVPSHVFDSVPELRELKLSGNPIQRILNDAFVRVPTLVRLELSECLLGTVETRAFSGLENTLEWLKLDKNKLVNVKSSTLTVMRNLHGLELSENPWNCTCELRPLREWMFKQNIPHDVSPACAYPLRLKGKPWDRLDLDEFACVPKISAPEALTTGVEGRNVTMSCNIDGIPEPRVKWLWRNRVIANLSGVPYSNGRKVYIVHAGNYISNLTILTADMQDAGVYVCTAENKAGKVEASVTLAVLRKPPDTALSGRVLAASIIVAALFVLASCLIVLCVCTVRRRQQGVVNGRWQDQIQSGMTRGARRRDDSYEKIEMNHKAASMSNHAGGGVVRGVLPKGGGNSTLASGQNAEVAIVGPTILKQRTRRGEYRGVPNVDTDLGEDDADDDYEGGYEDDAETPTPTTVVSSTRDCKTSWSGPRSSDGTPNSHSEILSSALSDPADLHIPRGAAGYMDNR